MKWTVSHYYTNPQNNTIHEFDNRQDAENEARIMSSDEAGSKSIIRSDHGHYGSRDWTQHNISWIPILIRQFLSEIGRKGGSISSEKKTRAVRKNAKLGGRPPNVTGYGKI